MKTFATPITPAESLPNLSLFSEEHRQKMWEMTSADDLEPVLSSIVPILPSGSYHPHDANQTLVFSPSTAVLEDQSPIIEINSYKISYFQKNKE